MIASAFFALALLASACTQPEPSTGTAERPRATPTSAVASPAATQPPSPTSTMDPELPSIQLGAIVRGVSPSERLITFEAANEGIDRAALLDDTRIVFDDGRRATLGDVKPGARIQVAGPPGDDAILARVITIVTRAGP